MWNKLFIYSFFSLVASIRSLFATKREAAITLALLIGIGYGVHSWQDAKNKKLLTVAVAGNAQTVTAVVKQEGARVSAQDEVGRTALHVAARYSNKEAVQALIAMGADVNARDEWGRTALHMTRYDLGDNIDIVRLLLEHGADPDAKDNKGETPLDILRRERRYNQPERDLIEEYSRRKQAQAQDESAQRQQPGSNAEAPPVRQNQQPPR